MPANPTGKTEATFKRAMESHRKGDQAQARKLYRAILKSHPNHAGALHLLGLLCFQQGDSTEALRLMRSAIRQQPDYLDALNNLGNVLLDMEQLDEAEKCYRKVLELNPAFAGAYSNLCVIYRKQGRLKEAIELGQTAVRTDPQHAIAWHNLGNSLSRAKMYQQALNCYDKVIQIDPGFSLAHDAYCRLTLLQESKSFFGRKKRKKSILAYQRWLECVPDTPLAKFMLQAVQGKDELARMPDTVVRDMFDKFAPHFEQSLGDLKYRVPGLVGPALQALLGKPEQALLALDAGCGTGLCGPAIRPYAAKMTGVDLSSVMLKKAAETGIYDQLVDAELVRFLKQNVDCFDIIVSGDTLIYFGPLEDVLQAAANALHKGGHLLFTLEKSPLKHDSKGHHLHANGRYFHSAAYVERTLAGAGFSDISMKDEVLRQEIGSPVAGLLISARMDQASGHFRASCST